LGNQTKRTYLEDHVARIGERIDVHMFLVGNRKKKKPMENPHLEEGIR
jgi:hypothetical protein